VADLLSLGVSDSHEAGVALVRGNRVLAALNEERLTRKKMAAGLPTRSLERIWEIAGVRPEEVQAVGLAGFASSGEATPTNTDFSNDAGVKLLSQRSAELIDSVPGLRRIQASNPASKLYRAALRISGRGRRAAIRHTLDAVGVRAPLLVFDHHAAHVASAYYTGGDPDALILTNDSFGDGLCSTVAVGDSRTNRFRILQTNSFFNSLGSYYNVVTRYCGFPKIHHAGKTTGLAAFGDPEKTLPIFRELIGWDSARGRYQNRGRLFQNCAAEVDTRLRGHSREDAAAGIQRRCEEILCAMVEHFVRRTGRRCVLVAGGIHANVRVNQCIAGLQDVERLYVFPSMGDGGLALGAAFLAATGDGPVAFQPSLLEHVYLGPAYAESEMLAAVEGHGLSCERVSDSPAVIARLLAEGRIVGRFDGRMEYGPRALGNRSILYPATRSDVNGWLNQRLGRTEFMPFAPVLRAADAPQFLSSHSRVTEHSEQFMTTTCSVTTRCRREAPAVVHVDGTARPQVLRRETNPDLFAVLDRYHHLTGLSVLVNTSFNMHEEPIVCSPEDAVRAFVQSGIDAVAMGPFILRQPGSRRVP